MSTKYQVQNSVFPNSRVVMGLGGRYVNMSQIFLIESLNRWPYIMFHVSCAPEHPLVFQFPTKNGEIDPLFDLDDFLQWLIHESEQGGLLLPEEHYKYD